MMTSCKDCVFAKYRDNVQYGCEFARLERFQLHGGIKLTQSKYVTGKDARQRDWPDANRIGYWDIAEYAIQGEESVALINPKVDHTKLDQIVKHYYIINRFCTRCRDITWAEKFAGQDIKQVAINENKLRLTTVLVVDKDSYDLKPFITSVVKQKIPVNQIIILNCLGIKSALKMSEVMGSLSEEFNIPEYNIISTIEQKRWKDASAELLVKDRIRNIYFSIFFGENEMPDNFTVCLDNALNERLERFLYLTSDCGATFSTQMFNMLNGFGESIVYEQKMTGFEEKMERIVENTGQHFLMRKLSEFIL